jgi:hypothetical protein
MNEKSSILWAQPTVKTARTAGAWYLLLTLTALPGYLFIPSLIVSGNAVTTASNILGSESFFRIAIVSTLVSTIANIPLLINLYRLLCGVHKTLAALMVALGIVTVPITFLDVPNLITALQFMHGGTLLSVFQKSQLDALAMVSLNTYSQGMVVNSIFFGLWLLPFGVLVYKSGFIPKIFGILLFVNGLAYVTVSFISLLGLPYGHAASLVAVIPEGIGEPSMIAWLLIKGIRARALNVPAIRVSQAN